MWKVTYAEEDAAAANVPVEVAEQPLALGKQADEELKGKSGRHLLLEVKGYPEPDPVLLVQNSLPDLVDQRDAFAAEFYRRFFAKSEEIRTLFHRDMGAQGRMLVEMLRSAVYALCRNDETRLGAHPPDPVAPSC